MSGWQSYRGRAEVVRLDSDEGGFRLIVETIDGSFDFSVQGVADELLDVLEPVREWRAEGEEVRREFLGARGGSARRSEARSGMAWHGSAGRGEGYETSDPKHPRFRDTHCDYADR